MQASAPTTKAFDKILANPKDPAQASAPTTKAFDKTLANPKDPTQASAPATKAFDDIPAKPKEAERKAPSDIRPVAFVGFAIIIVAFGAVGGWAATAPLGSAAVASGVIVAETNKKTVQHFEGGIVAKINVREGAHVRANDVLFRLDATQPQANFDIYRNQLINAMAQEARLVAEQNKQDKVTFPEFPAEYVTGRSDPVVELAMADQRRQFQERRGSLDGQIGLLYSKVEQLKQEIEGLKLERVSKVKQVDFLVDEITGLRELFEKGFAPKNRLLALEREKASIEGQIGRADADRAKAENGINEANLQIVQVQQQFFEQVVKDLVDTRSKIADLRERVTVARDVLRRLDILAPTTGTVQNLRVFTIGAVIRAGDPLIDIVPDNDDLVVQAQFSPSELESLSPGMQAEVRFTSFSNRTMPMIPGTIRSLSRDRLVDSESKQPYFLAVVVVQHKDLPAVLSGRLTPGLPAEVIVPTTERTVVEYLVQPLLAILRKTMRER